MGEGQPELIVFCGYPGSGKSTHARAIVGSARPVGSCVAVSRDDLRWMLYRQGWRGGVGEEAVTVAQLAMVRGLLAASVSVVVHDTNLPTDVQERWAGLADECGARLTWVDLRDVVDVEECIRRDARRPLAKRVGALVIRKMAAEHPPAG